MKLYVQIVKDGETVDWAVANMRGAAQFIGWNIFLHDVLESARSRLAKIAA